MELVHLDCEISFYSLYHEVLSNGFELVADIGIVPLSTPFLLQQFESLF